MKPSAPRAIALLLCLSGCGGEHAPAAADDQSLPDTGAPDLSPGELEVSFDADDCDELSTQSSTRADGRANPDADEVCNGLDDDCNGWVDDADLELADGQVYYRDGDGDGYGVDGRSVIRCLPPAGFAWRGGDCDDADAGVFPGADEVCDDGRERDCDGLLDCEDGDCFAGPDGVPAAGCGEICGDNVDNDADDLTDCADDECFAGLECADAYRVPPLLVGWMPPTTLVEGAAREHEDTDADAIQPTYDALGPSQDAADLGVYTGYWSTYSGDLWRLGSYPLYLAP